MKVMNLSLLVGLSLFLGGCNTMEGMGTDMRKAGEAIESSAERNKDECAPQRPTYRRNTSPYSSPRSPSPTYRK